MRLTRLSLLAPACAAWLLVTAASATAAPPVNDNYLSSLQMTRGNGVARTFSDVADTTEATTQADLFNPNRDGLPFGGAPAEETRCGATEYGKTVWYDFAPETFGAVHILASGFDAVVRVYEYDARTAMVTRTVLCQNDSPGAVEDVLLPSVARGQAYTVQVGGVGSGAVALAGRLDFRFEFFADQDRDGVLDAAPDRCPQLDGIPAAAGCPPELRPSPRIAFQSVPGGIRLTRLQVDGLPSGAVVEARCAKCHLRQKVTVRGGSVALKRFVGKELSAGSRLELRALRRRAPSGRFRFGAIGAYLRYDIRAGSLGRRIVRCLVPGSRVPRQRCA